MSITKKSMTVLVAVLAVGAVTTAALAATTNRPAPGPRASDSRVLDGTWQTTVQLTDAPPGAPTSFNALDTFVSDGSIVVSSSAPNPSSRGLAHGTWTHTDHRNFTSSFVWFRFDAAGAFAGTQRVQRTMKLSHDGSSFTATDLVEVIAPSGAILVTIHGTEVGQRLPG